MGVSGCGKSTIGSALAARLGVDFIDGDDLHPESNKRKMASGKALTDLDRVPWLEEVARNLITHEKLVLACSALKRSYRDEITKNAPGVNYIHLSGAKELISSRLQSRSGHFMPVALLDSQFETLEELDPSESGKVVDISKSVSEIVDAITNLL